MTNKQPVTDIEELYTDYYKDLEEFENENKTGNCQHCQKIKRELTRVINPGKPE